MQYIGEVPFCVQSLIFQFDSLVINKETIQWETASKKYILLLNIILTLFVTIEHTACVRIRSVCAFLTCRGGTGGFQLTEWGQCAWMSHNRQEFTESWMLAAHTPQTWNAAQQSQQRGHYVTCGLRATSAWVAAPLATSEVKAKPGCHLVTSHNSMTVFVCYHGQTRPLIHVLQQ